MIFTGLAVYECKYNREIPTAQVVSPCFCYAEKIVCAAKQEAIIVDWSWPCATTNTTLTPFDVVVCDEGHYHFTNFTKAQSSMLTCDSIITKDTKSLCGLFEILRGIVGCVSMLMLLIAIIGGIYNCIYNYIRPVPIPPTMVMQVGFNHDV